jgi:hypothetical protein
MNNHSWSTCEETHGKYSFHDDSQAGDYDGVPPKQYKTFNFLPLVPLPCNGINIRRLLLSYRLAKVPTCNGNFYSFRANCKLSDFYSANISENTKVPSEPYFLSCTLFKSFHADLFLQLVKLSDLYSV